MLLYAWRTGATPTEEAILEQEKDLGRFKAQDAEDLQGRTRDHLQIQGRIPRLHY